MKKGRGKDRKQRKRKGKGVFTVKNALLGVGAAGSLYGLGKVVDASIKADSARKTETLNRQLGLVRETLSQTKANLPKIKITRKDGKSGPIFGDEIKQALEAKRIELGATPTKLSKSQRSLKLQKYRESLGGKPIKLNTTLRESGKSETRGSRQSRTMSILGVGQTTKARRKQLVGFSTYLT